MIVEEQHPPSRAAARRLTAYRGLQDLDDDWTEGVAAAAQVARDELLLTTGRISSGPAFDATRVATMRQLRLLREMRARGRGTEQDGGVRSEIRALGRGELLRQPGETAASLDGGEPCPVLSDEWHLLDDVPPADVAVLDLDTKHRGGAAVVAPPERPTLLRPGTCFTGTQCCNRIGNTSDDWEVSVRIEECDWDTGYVCGSMTAENVPQTHGPVSTFFEGCVVGVGRHTFVTEDWGADKSTDWAHWQKFPAFQRMQPHLARAVNPEEGAAEEAHAAASAAAAAEDVVFMRWKEKSFETKYGERCGLTIAGFYYLALSCGTGNVQGYYYDSQSQPFQKLNLRAMPSGRHGFCSSAFQFQ